VKIMQASRKIKGSGLARFMELRGRRIEEGAGALWHSVEKRFYMAVPYQLMLAPDPDELDRTLRRINGLGLRFPSRDWSGVAAGLYVCRDRDYDVPKLQKTCRNLVRRGVEQCEVREASVDELLEQGLRLNCDSMGRQGRFDAEFGEPKGWQRLVHAIPESPAIRAVGVFVDGQLASYGITCREDGWVHVLHQNSRSDLLKHNPNHVLTYHVTREAMLDTGIEAICYGHISLVATDGLQDYKIRMGYEVEPHFSAMHLHPAISSALTSVATLQSLAFLRRLRPRDQMLERAATVLAGAKLARRRLLPLEG
jgi:hypothetical protein